MLVVAQNAVVSIASKVEDNVQWVVTAADIAL